MQRSIERLSALGFEMVDQTIYKTTNTRMKIKCIEHGIIWVSTVGDAYRKAKYYFFDIKLKNRILINHGGVFWRKMFQNSYFCLQ